MPLTSGALFRKLITLLTIALAFTFSIAVVQAQNYYRVKSILVEDGLSQSTCSSFAQDSLGFLWIGTHDGLNRYDGKTFKVYRATKQDTLSLQSSYASCAVTSPQNELWVGVPGGISHYQFKTDDFINYQIWDNPLQPRSVVFDIEFINATTIWVATQNGLFSFDRIEKKFSEIETFRNLAIRNISQSNTSGIWVSTADGLFRQPKNTTTWKRYTTANGLSNNNIQTAYEDTTGTLVGTADGLDHFVSESDSFVPLPGAYKKTKGPVQAILRDKTGKLWIGAQNTLVLDRNNRPITLTAINSILRNEGLMATSEILGIFETKDGTIWIGKSIGLLAYIDAPTFKSVPLEQWGAGTGADVIASCYTADDTTLYVGSFFNGLNIVNLKTNEIRNYFKPDQSNLQSVVSAITQVKNGTLWLATDNGLIQFNSKAPEKSKHFLKGEVGNKNYILQIEEYDSSIFLLSVLFKGMMLYDYKKDSVLKTITFPLTAPYIYLDENQIYVASRNQVKIFDRRGNLVRESNGFSNFIRRVLHMKKDSRGWLWIATEGDGLFRWVQDEDKFIHYSVAQGLSNPVVYRIEEDNIGNLWLSTNGGLSVFSPQTEKFLNFGIADGLQSLEFNTGASFRSSSGTLYFGGLRGLNYFTPEQLLLESKPVETYVSSISINGKEFRSVDTNERPKNVLLTKQLDLSYRENNVAFKFISLDYVHPHRIRYQCKLENFSDDWIDLENRDYVNFTNLPPGEYFLHVRTSPGNGILYPSINMMHITIHAPFWLKPTYQIVGFVLFTLFGFIFYKVRVRHLKNARRRLENIVKMRTKEIQQQKEEIASQNEELVSQTELLADKNKELEIKSSELEIKSNELETLTHLLEDKIAERTQKLNLLNRDLVEQNIRLEQFNFITAHNLRGPIASLKGLINIFPKLEDEESRELLKRIDGCSDRLFEIVKDLTLVLGIRGGAQGIMEPVHLKHELLITFDSLREAIQSKNVLIDYSNFDEQATISGVRTYVQSIFYNLLNNAIKYSRDQGQPTIEITCRLEDNKVKIMVRDNGIGIDMRYAEGKIFQLYQRFNTHTQGKGLGLFLVKSEVDTLEGTITVESGLNVGTTFFLEFNQYTQSE